MLSQSECIADEGASIGGELELLARDGKKVLHLLANFLFYKAKCFCFYIF